MPDRPTPDRSAPRATEPAWYVDDRCTNCDVARQLAPGLIVEAGDGRSRIRRQPRDASEERALYAAAFACPTRSVRPPRRADPARDPFPLALDDAVHLCGHNARSTAGANSYLLRRPSGTRMMIDTPRWSAALADRYERLGRITDVLLTHRDHAAHGRRWADRLGARLWVHEGDLDAAPDADRVLRGTAATEVADGVVAHPLPGHTEGSVVYVADERHCFSGDSFFWSRATGDIEVAETVTWYSITELAASLARTAGRLRFTFLLPGHGGRKLLSRQEAARRMAALTRRVAALEPRPVDFTALRW